MKNKIYCLLIIVALSGVIGWTCYGSEQRTGAAKPTWEYQVVNAPTDAGPGSKVSAFRAQEVLNRRGAEGWELVGVGGQGLLYLRRAR